MLRWTLLLMLIAGAHFSLTVLLPAHAGRAWLLWPVAADTQPVARVFAGEGRYLTIILLVMSGFAFLAASASLVGWLVPAALWPTLVMVGSFGSILLFLIYLNRYALLPLLVDAVLLWGVTAQQWSAAVRGF